MGRRPKQQTEGTPRSTQDTMLAISSGIKEDAQAIGGVIKRWTALFESTGEEVFTWAKKHKFLLAVATTIFLIVKFLLDEQKKTEDY